MLINANVQLTLFANSPKSYCNIDQEVMTARYWNDTDEDGDCRRRRQAEFLVYREVPWHLIRAVCVKNQAIANQVESISQQFGQTLTIRLRPQWYYD